MRLQVGVLGDELAEVERLIIKRHDQLAETVEGVAHLTFITLERVGGNDLVVLLESSVNSIRDELAPL